MAPVPALTLTYPRQGYCCSCWERRPLDPHRLCLVCRVRGNPAGKASLRRLHLAALALAGALVRQESGRGELARLDRALCDLAGHGW
jgi:hypothetical protein